MKNNKNSVSLKMGEVTLNVKDLILMRNFYYQVLKLDILKETDKVVLIGKDNIPILKLISTPQLPNPAKDEAGLYHVAILFSSKGELARTLHSVLKKTPQFFSGSSDHLVSEAFYLYDPEGNGIEIYCDRDKNLWQWENNQITMASMYIDPVDYIRQYLTLKENQSTLSIGHIHLKVGNIAQAKHFYVDILNFEIVADMNTALFISKDKYHHHIGMNIWESEGATARKESLGLRNFELIYSKTTDYEIVKTNLKKNMIPVIEHNNSMVLSDPWNNQITVALAQS